MEGFLQTPEKSPKSSADKMYGACMLKDQTRFSLMADAFSERFFKSWGGSRAPEILIPNEHLDAAQASASAVFQILPLLNKSNMFIPVVESPIENCWIDLGYPWPENSPAPYPVLPFLVYLGTPCFFFPARISLFF